MTALASAGVWTLRVWLVGATAWLTVYTLGPRPDILPWDKAEHFLAALALFLLLAGSFPRAPLWSLAGVLTAAIVLSELAQTALPGRAAGVADGMAGMLGLAAGLSAALVLSVRRSARVQPA